MNALLIKLLTILATVLLECTANTVQVIRQTEGRQINTVEPIQSCTLFITIQINVFLKQKNVSKCILLLKLT